MKKDDKSLIRKSVNTSMRAMKKFIIGSQIGRTIEEIKEEVEETLIETKKKVSEIADHLVAKMLSFYLIIIGLFIGFIGLALFLVENTKLSAGSSFILVGAAVLVLGWIFLRKK